MYFDKHLMLPGVIVIVWFLTSGFWEVLIRRFSLQFYIMQGDGNVSEGEEKECGSIAVQNQ